LQSHALANLSYALHCKDSEHEPSKAMTFISSFQVLCPASPRYVLHRIAQPMQTEAKSSLDRFLKRSIAVFRFVSLRAAIPCKAKIVCPFRFAAQLSLAALIKPKTTEAKIVYPFAPSIASLSCVQRCPAEFTQPKIFRPFATKLSNAASRRALRRIPRLTKAKILCPFTREFCKAKRRLAQVR
jgi:hypothetical protein